MKELEVLVSESVFDKFAEAWNMMMDSDEPVTFIHNKLRIIIVKDTNETETVPVEKIPKPKVTPSCL